MSFTWFAEVSDIETIFTWRNLLKARLGVDSPFFNSVQFFLSLILTSEIGDDTVQVNEVLDEDNGDDMGLIDDEEEESEVQINTYWPEATITAGKVSEVLVSVKVNGFRNK